MEAKRDHWADKIGIWLSAVCLVHCLVTPVIVLLVPLLAVLSYDHTHKVLALVLPLIALPAFISGFKHHGRWSVAILGLIGLFLIEFAAMDPLGIFQQAGEEATTIAGSLFLLFGHIHNRRGQSPAKSTRGKCLKIPVCD